MDSKQCKDCKITKSLTEFKSNQLYSQKRGYYTKYEPRCNPCLKIHNHNNYMRNRENNIAASKRYYEKNWQKQRDYQNQYKQDHRLEMLDYYTQYYWEHREHIIGLTKEYREENKEYYNEFQKKRRELIEALPFDINENEIEQIYEFFDGKCALTEKENDITLEHFIPIAWGHGGTYLGNIYPLNISLNQSKRDVNPFEWIKKERVENEVIPEKWAILIDFLAKQNNLSYDDFVDYIYWCEANKRPVEQIKNDGDKYSLELFRESKIR